MGKEMDGSFVFCKTTRTVRAGFNRFNREECRYLLGFTESIHYLKKCAYAVTFANFSENKTDKWLFHNLNRRPCTKNMIRDDSSVYTCSPV